MLIVVIIITNKTLIFGGFPLCQMLKSFKGIIMTLSNHLHFTKQEWWL